MPLSPSTPTAGPLNIGTLYSARLPGARRMMRPPDNTALPESMPTPTGAVGFGTRAGWPLQPVGESARRDPHVPDGPLPGRAVSASQANASPPVPGAGPGYGLERRQLHAGGGGTSNGQHAYIIYVKRLGTMMTATLGKSFLFSQQESRWRVGGVSYPMESNLPMASGLGPGYHGDAGTLWPDNPQLYMRNPGIRPHVNVPATYRYAPGMGIQAVGPSLAQVGQAGRGQ